MNKYNQEGLKTGLFVGAGTLIGGLIHGLMQSGQEPSAQVIARTALFVIMVIVIAVFIFRKIK
ncbi:MAG: hypothetical protein KAS13_08905 [Candidatus Omnitrophica bacterium]|nr:hypothetical protein [Candidatus Omnitrophota bacterium]